ncbi:hypothetical protein FACS189419_05840 [Planctomycetales bacterium]|nr:hypothetical protein FACS189419_05840 [Planctomycetales bacterium]
MKYVRFFVVVFVLFLAAYGGYALLEKTLQRDIPYGSVMDITGLYTDLEIEIQREQASEDESKVYYVVFQSLAHGKKTQKFQQKFQYTGKEKVSDALADINAWEPNSSKRVSIVRTGNSDKRVMLHIDCVEIAAGRLDTDYQLLPGDRLWVIADRYNR